MSEDFINLEKKPSSKKDITLSIIILLLVFLFIFGFVVLREYSLKEVLSSVSQRITEEAGEIFSGKEDIDEEEKEDIEESVERKYYKKTAQEGDGLTHLARRAVTSYMEEEKINLSEEERVYVEDYVQKRLHTEKEEPRFLDIGEEVEISLELIYEGVSSAKNLTSQQIDNLSQYSVLVNF